MIGLLCEGCTLVFNGVGIDDAIFITFTSENHEDTRTLAHMKGKPLLSAFFFFHACR